MSRGLKPLQRHERAAVAMLFLYGFGNAAAYVLARTIADSAFLSHIGPEHLPPMYMVSAGVVAFASVVYSRLTQHTAPHRAVALTLVMFAASAALLPELMHRLSSSITAFAIVYLLTQIRGTLGTIHYATLVNEHFSKERPERVIGLAGAGATFAGFLMGMAIGAIPNDVDVASLMYAVVAIDLLTIVPVTRLAGVLRSQTTNGTTRQEATASTGLTRWAIRNSYVRGIGAVVLLGVIVATVVEFQWKASVAEHFNREEANLAEYFGYYYGVVYLLTGLMQLFVTGRLLERRGVFAGLAAFPFALLATAIGVLVFRAERFMLWAVTCAKGCDILKRSMNDPSIQLLYGPLESGTRRQAITFVAGIVKPLAEALAAIALLGLSRWLTLIQLSALVAVMVLGWLTTGFKVWKSFRYLANGCRDKAEGP
ncbi:MAG: hypothetical protein H6822_22830 [Planctomycetaceae bacterium]|nr:hypothetical protein [Planctomycetales bacterium]MCB9925031.1 hypothetical protein [Planctomycetaceae bacterium]